MRWKVCFFVLDGCSGFNKLIKMVKVFKLTLKYRIIISEHFRLKDFLHPAIELQY